MKFVKEFTVTRRKLLDNGKWISSLLVAGLIGGIPWRVIDSIKQRQTTPKRGRLLVTGSLIGRPAVITATKAVGSTSAPPDSPLPGR